MVEFSNNSEETDVSNKLQALDNRILLKHQKRALRCLIILVMALICHGVTLKKSEI